MIKKIANGKVIEIIEYRNPHIKIFSQTKGEVITTDPSQIENLLKTGRQFVKKKFFKNKNKKIKPKKIKPPARRYLDKLKAYGKQLEANLPKSEQRFRKFYNKHTEDQYNSPLGCFIPDVHNNRFKYVIEIDGSIHTTPDQIVKDLKKNDYYLRHGYYVIRIVDHDFVGLALGLEVIYSLQNEEKRFITQEDINLFLSSR